MRELKFRAWNKDKKCFFKWDISMGFAGTDKIWGEVQQYTGIKDKDGKEIYEGDIIQWEDTTSNFPHVIERREKIKIIHAFRTEPSMLFAGNEYELIGNIQENPELLTS